MGASFALDAGHARRQPWRPIQARAGRRRAARDRGSALAVARAFPSFDISRYIPEA
jgi:hypothetical protein